ncbi:hypothetical protein BJ912DRAFT_1041697 [Pholiota molesta]|nr:hypothetical protein BJ912DRAFT_1041697 [Pholiota molesta]
MSLSAALLLLGALWALLHLLHFLTTHGEPALLPTKAHTPPRRLLRLHRTVSLQVRGLWLQVSTTGWNGAHDRLGAFLTRRGNRARAQGVRGFYAVGVGVGAAGMLLAVLGLCGVCLTSGWGVFRKIAGATAGGVGYAGVATEVRRLGRRSAAAGMSGGAGGALPAGGAASFPTITPIIPGVTVPLAHLPVLLAAVFLAQVVHELGHALAAALEDLQISACGASLTVCVPAAFVAFPAGGVQALRPPARARVVAAGPWHNLVLWLLLGLAARAGVGRGAAAVAGYRDVAGVGRVVVGVNQESPLSLHLQPGSIITQLDDTPLVSEDYSKDAWTSYLQGTMQHSSLGWCVANTVLAKTDDCCTTPNKLSSFSCFVSQDTAERGCMDPVPVLTSQHSQRRCQSSAQCPLESACVVPAKDAQLLRLTVRPTIADVDGETVVLWSGPPVEIWEEVQVSTWAPRIWILPLWAPPLVAIFWEYLTMATLSLYFFNLLPLPHLDGTELLHSLLDWAFEMDNGAVSYNFSALEAGENDREEPRTRRRWKERIMRYTPYAMCGLVICSILLSILNAVY